MMSALIPGISLPPGAMPAGACPKGYNAGTGCPDYMQLIELVKQLQHA